MGTRKTRAQVVAAARAMKPRATSPSEPHTIPTIEYVYRGQIERWAKGWRRGQYARPRWQEGYSQTVNGCISYPWMTKRECQRDARLRGGRAIFVRP